MTNEVRPKTERRRAGNRVTLVSTMPVNTNNYDHRGGGNYGVAVRLPQIVSYDRLVDF